MGASRDFPANFTGTLSNRIYWGRHRHRRTIESKRRRLPIVMRSPLPKDALTFSTERQERLRAHHCREEPRAQLAASRHELTYTRPLERSTAATAGHAAPCRALRMRRTTPVTPPMTKSRNVHATVTPTTGIIIESPLVEVRTPDSYSTRTVESKYVQAEKKTPGTESTVPTRTKRRHWNFVMSA